MKKKFSIISILALIFLCKSVNLYAGNIFIVKKINNEIITNIDLKKEFNYLIALNPKLKNLKENELLKIAEDSLIREKIKLIEINKFEFLKELESKIVVENNIDRIISNLGLTDQEEFAIYLNDFGTSVSEVKEKITIEVMWNQLIGSKFNNKININKQKLLTQIKEDNLDKSKINEYELSEITFNAENQNDYTNKVSQIYSSIKNEGFANTASKFSVSETSKIGGYIGKIKENQLSEIIRNELSLISINEQTKPIKIGTNFIILQVESKSVIEQEINIDDILENLIVYETNKQYENFSQIYFNKVKMNILENEQ
ncbi:peptidylprolyl isomerase [Candidatus Pelagibacter bacterium]|nr:peptidylprolyl isomerase [Candidatus Pelagibacter bacterium]